MTRLLIALLLAARVAYAEDPSDFRVSAPITLQGKESLNRLTLPFEAYRDARPDLADLRIFNAKGEALPIAYAGQPDPQKESPAAIGLPLFPVAAAPQGQTMPQGDLNVVVRSDSRGTIVSVQGRTQGALAPARTAAWLVDATRLEQPIAALVFDWEVNPGTEVAHVNVEASDDLRTWRYVASRAPLVHVERNGLALEQKRVDTGLLKAKYLRVTGDPSAFLLRGLMAQPGDVVKPAPRIVTRVMATAGAKPGEYSFDLRARPPVTALRIVPGEANTVAPVVIETRDAPTGPARQVARATFYRITRDGAELESQPLEIAPTSARYWSIHLDPRSPGLGSVMPELEVHWRPAQVVFVMRGDGAPTLAFGNARARREVLAVSELIPKYERGDELKLPEAKVGLVTAVPESALDRWVGEVSPRKALLWAILVLAVAALGFMAWKLLGQMKAQK